MNHYAFPAYSLPQAKRASQTQFLLKQQSPGPDYLPKPQKNKAFTISKSSRPDTVKQQNEISPFKYNPNKVLPNSPNFSIPLSSSTTKLNQNPAPGWYEPNENAFKQKIQTYSIGQKYESVLEPKNNHPGPGHYQIKNETTILKKSSSIKQTKFGTSRRFSYSQSPALGVGDYQINADDKGNKKVKVQTFGKASKFKQDAQILPGPSDYLKPSQFQHRIQRQPGKTIAGRHENPQKIDITTNSFGKYFENPEKSLVNRQTSRKFSIGKGKRSELSTNGTPGPADYINDNFRTKSVPAITIPNYHKSQIQYEKQMRPGPQTYNLEAKQKKGVTIPRSQSQGTISQIPGVGRYQLQPDKTKPKGASIGKSKRTSFVSLNAPGVGSYEIVKTLQKKIVGTISRANRFGERTSQYGAGPAPGPSDYHIHSSLAYKTIRH